MCAQCKQTANTFLEVAEDGVAAMVCVLYHLSVSVCAVTADILSEFLEVAIHSVLSVSYTHLTLPTIVGV